MALIRSATEAKAALPRVLSNLNNSSLVPDTSAAEYKYLLPITGYDLYHSIDTKINNDPPDALSVDETSLLSKMRAVVVCYAYLDDLGTDNAKITDNGVRSADSANMPRAFGWQYKELKNALISKAFDATETLIRFLFENKSSFSDWTNSDEYKSINSLFIKTGTDFDAHYKLFQPMRSFYSLKNLIDEVQDDFIVPALGKDLTDWMASTEVFSEDEALFVKYVKKAICYMTIKKACEHYSVRFDANGFTILSTTGDQENSETAGRTNSDISLFEMKKNACIADAQTYLAKAKKEIVTYYNSLTSPGSSESDFIAAYEAGPLVNYTDPQLRDLGNSTRKGIVRL